MSLISRLRHPKPDITKRNIANATGAELFALIKHYGHELRAVVYFYGDKRVIAAPLTGKPGDIQVEVQETTVENEPSPNARIGYIALDALLNYSPKKPPSQRKRQITDWPAFKASGSKSPTEFNRNSVSVSLRTLNGSIELEAASASSPEQKFAVRAWAPASITHEEMGELLRQLVRGAQIIQKAGLV